MRHKLMGYGAIAILAAAIGGTAAAQQTQALTVTASVTQQQCLTGDFVAVVLHADAESTSQPIGFAWDFNNDGQLDTRLRTSADAIRIFPDEVAVTVRVVARNAEGDLAQDTVTFGTLRCE